MLESLVRNAGLASHFDEILSVDRLQTYKPDPGVYQLAVETLGLPKERILFVSSNGWDVAGSKAFGFTVAWVNRQGEPHDELGMRPDYVVGNLLELADVVTCAGGSSKC
jgi:2-haloacid dehalogenase